MSLMKTFAVLIAFLFFAGSVHAIDNSSFTPLIEAVKNKNASPYAIGTLILKGGYIQEHDAEGRSVLMLAAMYHPDPLVHFLLISNGADVNERMPDTGKTALFYAVQYNSNPEVVAALLNYGADQNIEDVFGRTAYDYAGRNPKLRDSIILYMFSAHHDDEDEDNNEEASSVSAASR